MESRDEHNAEYGEHISDDHHDSNHNGGEHSGDLSHLITGYLEHLMDIFEIGIAIIVALGFIASVFPLARKIPLLLSMHTGTESYRHFLESALDLVIGIEFIKMLVKHTPGSVVEVLLFALSRHMVLAGGSARDNLLTVCAIAIIFAIRKYLFIPSFEFSEGESEIDWLTDWKEIRKKGRRRHGSTKEKVKKSTAKEEPPAESEEAAKEVAKEAAEEPKETFEKAPGIDDFREVFDEPPVTDDFREV